ncbi:DUF6705 family protein [Chryseobacterium zhengzhouense]|uniref:DUF6705 family protein n=1 Tax=Chryseobacterium zhengzhouense TaxID=1636086 RepID=A0ABW2M2B4_9FLAO
MKYLIFILTFTVFLQCKSQTQIVNLTDCDSYINDSSGDYYRKDVNNVFSPYEGIWRWTQGNKEFTLTLIKQKHHYTQYANYNYYEDRLVGYYQYKENGVLIADTSSDDLNKDYSPKVIFNLNCHSRIVSLSFKDYKKNKNYIVLLEKISPTQIKFTGKEEGDVLVSRSAPGTYAPIYGGNTFPLNMVLTKQ